MAAHGKQVAVTDVAAVVAKGAYALLVNRDTTNSIYIGGQTVDATGFEIMPGESFEVDASLDAISAVCAAGLTATLHILTVRRAYR